MNKQFLPLTKDGAKAIETQKLVMRRERDPILFNPDDEIHYPFPTLFYALPIAILFWIGLVGCAILILAALGVIR